MKRTGLAVAAVLALAAFPGSAAEQSVEMNRVGAEGVGEAIGTVRLWESPFGLMLALGLSGLEPGGHGFHIHQNPDCGPAEKNGALAGGVAAGGHFDPAGTGAHHGPYGEGHLGDLPVLWVSADGTASHPILAPRLALADVRDRALMIHAMGDNYADDPKALGGGGARVACGIIR